jgi:hypothetical protein
MAQSRIRSGLIKTASFASAEHHRMVAASPRRRGSRSRVPSPYIDAAGSPPYINQLTRSPERATFLVTDATGAVLPRLNGHLRGAEADD